MYEAAAGPATAMNERVAVQAAVLSALCDASGRGAIWPETTLAELELDAARQAVVASELRRALAADVEVVDVEGAATAAALIDALAASPASARTMVSAALR